MAIGLRDRDAIITSEGLIFRVYGYFHPPSGYVCDIEYAPPTLYYSSDPKAYRRGANGIFFKFFEDNGLKFIADHFPQYHVFYHPLSKAIVGVQHCDIHSTKIPIRVMQTLIATDTDDELIITMKETLKEIISISTLKTQDFGVFGSILHNFYHPHYSDIDLIIVGKKKLIELRDVLSSLYKSKGGRFANEFTSPQSWSKRSWKFVNFSIREYEWHQRRKLIYGTHTPPLSNRRIKFEFEPVRAYSEITNEYDVSSHICMLGWVEAWGRIVNDDEGGFMPSIYQIEIDKASDHRAVEARRIISYVEEFRMQVEKGEKFYVAGNLERVTSLRNQFYQLTLTYGPRYYEQTLKLMKG